MNRRMIAALTPLALLAGCAHQRADYSQFTVAEPQAQPITRYADANNDGKVTREEAKADPALARSFDQYDLDKNDVLDRSEFARLEAAARDEAASPNEAEANEFRGHPPQSPPGQQLTYTVISNWTDGAWPIIALLNDQLDL